VTSFYNVVMQIAICSHYMQVICQGNNTPYLKRHFFRPFTYFCPRVDNAKTNTFNLSSLHQ